MKNRNRQHERDRQQLDQKKRTECVSRLLKKPKIIWNKENKTCVFVMSKRIASIIYALTV